MELYYVDGGPFETTSLTGRGVFIVAYDAARNEFLAAPPDGNPFWNSCLAFDPPPPIPAAARKPQVGEVWVFLGERVEVVRLVLGNGAAGWLTTTNAGTIVAYEIARRPATPEEAEPYRPMLDGLKRSLGEA